MKKPYLSVIATSRNDNHGGNALWRTQHFVSGLAAQALAFEVPIELILVDWNPPPEKPSLKNALTLPTDNPYFHSRVIQVPHAYHQQFQFSDQLPLFQYLAKNVGIYRAQGEYVLATNIDILFSNALMKFLKAGLKPGHVYRVDRFDIEADIPDGLPFPKVLEYAENHIIRVNSSRGTIPYSKFKAGIFPQKANFIHFNTAALYTALRMLVGYTLKNFNYYITLPKSLKDLQKRPLGNPKKNLFNLAFGLKQQFWPLSKILHTCACGDFTLMSKQDWHDLKGYPEWEIFSWHIDSVLIYQAYHNGLKMVSLNSSYPIFHIEHGKGSGWTPEGANALFNRLDEGKITYLDDKDLEEIFFQQAQNKKQGLQTIYNQTWGAADQHFAED